MKLTEKEKKELLEMADSSKLREDFERIRKNRYNPLIINGKVDLDRVIDFLTQFNEFINHRPKPFRKIIDKDIRL